MRVPFLSGANPGTDLLQDLDLGSSRSADPLYGLGQALGIDLTGGSLGQDRKDLESVREELDRMKHEGFWGRLKHILGAFVPGAVQRRGRQQQLEDYLRAQEAQLAQKADERKWSLFQDLLDERQAQAAAGESERRAKETSQRGLLAGLAEKILGTGRGMPPGFAEALGLPPEYLEAARAKSPEEKLAEELGLIESPAGQKLYGIESGRKVDEFRKQQDIIFGRQKQLQRDQSPNVMEMDPETLARYLAIEEKKSAARAGGSYAGTVKAMEGGGKPATSAKGLDKAREAVNVLSVFAPRDAQELLAQMEEFLSQSPPPTPMQIEVFATRIQGLAAQAMQQGR